MRIPAKVLTTICAGCVFASGYFFGDRSRNNLDEVDPPLQKVSECALSHSPYDFVVVDGGRTATEHAINRANGRSWIDRSRHQDGKAIDFAALVDGKITYEIKYYVPIISAFKACSLQMNIPIISGGDWKKAQDYMHIELDRRYYP